MLWHRTTAESKDDQRGDFDPALVRSWLRHALKLDKDPERCAEFERWLVPPTPPGDGN